MNGVIGGVGDEQLSDLIAELSASGSSAVTAAADSVLAELSAPMGAAGASRAVREDSLLPAYAAAVESGDSASMPVAA